MKVTLAGIGMDGNRTLTKEAAEAISRADLLIGASRMLSPFADSGKRLENCYDFEKIAQILQDAADAGDVKEAAVLLSGDTGFFSGAKKLLEYLEHKPEYRRTPAENIDLMHLGQDAGAAEKEKIPNGGQDVGSQSDAGYKHGEHGLDIAVLPGISSLAALCAKIGLSYENMKIVSLHGREDNIAVHVLRNEKTFFLLGGKADAAALCRCLTRYSLGHVTVHVGENLGTETEQITTGMADELCQLKTRHLAAAIVCNPKPLRYLPCGIDDEAFFRIIGRDEKRNAGSAGSMTSMPQSCRGMQVPGAGDMPAAGSAAGSAGRTIPMTKSEVRAVAVSKLKICENDICWDVGCGTGSVTVEMALRCPGGFVYGYDQNEAAAELTMRNAEKFSCDNIRAVTCSFPPEHEALPAPDAVFIGGAGGRIDEIVNLALRLNPAVRIVITAVTLETLEEARAVLIAAFGNCEVTQIAVTKAQQAGHVTMMRANNPVFILAGADVQAQDPAAVWGTTDAGETADS